MKNEINNSRLKVFLILSIICNIAFIGGYIIKKTVFSSKTNGKNLYFSHESDEDDDKHFEGHEGRKIHELCRKNPAFNKVFKEHCKLNYDTMMQIHSLRNKMLEEIKKGVTDLKVFEETFSKLALLNTEIEKENIHHFIELKKILGDKKFEQLTQRMKKRTAMQTHKMNRFYQSTNKEKTKPNTK